MKLYLVQHAEAKKKEEDKERSLSEKGIKNIKKVASFITENIKIKPSKIFHSGKTRARQTAEVLAKYLNPTNGISEAKGLAPLDDPSIWAERIAEIKEIKEEIMLVGHLPHLSKLSSLLLCQHENKNIINIQMGGIVCLQRDELANWSVDWIVTPGILKNN